MKISIALLSKSAQVPTQNKKGDAGYDLYSISTGILKPGERALFKTGVAMAIPHGYYGHIAPRSGYAAKNGIAVMAGVVDSTYRGDIGVLLLNTSNENMVFGVGSKIAQIIIKKCEEVEFEVVDQLDETDRGEKGFGSSGA